MKCCNKYLKDSHLQIVIESSGTKKNGCERRDSKAICVTDPSKLYLHFNKVCETYRRSSGGRGLCDLMNEERQIFDLFRIMRA